METQKKILKQRARAEIYYCVAAHKIENGSRAVSSGLWASRDRDPCRSVRNRICGAAKCISLETSPQNLPTKDPRLNTILDNGGASPLSKRDQKTKSRFPHRDAQLVTIHCHREYEAILESNAKETPSNITCEGERKEEREIYLYVAA
jgi:hypothetical protein